MQCVQHRRVSCSVSCSSNYTNSVLGTYSLFGQEKCPSLPLLLYFGQAHLCVLKGREHCATFEVKCIDSSSHVFI